jgi:glycosyltransferase involved in cell wall biosynthesis
MNASAPAIPGPLDGLTVLRFAHAFESGGGTERYLDDLDRALLERSALTVVRLHLTRQAPPAAPIETALGRGRLVLHALPIALGGDARATAPSEPVLRPWLKRLIRDCLLYPSLGWRLFGEKFTARMRLAPEAGQAVGAGAAAAGIFRARRVDLVVLHFFGGADAEEVIHAARAAGVPFVVLNHYSNDRFLHLAIRKHARLAAGVAGVNGLDLPDYVRVGFANLSDGIDTEFFRPAHARPLSARPLHPVVLLPARVTREKGQHDLVRAAAALRRDGVDCTLAFAGRVDSSGFVNELKAQITRAGLEGRVLFLGNLSVEELRDWYAASSVVAFPTYHHEGLGRVIVEAQAMERPVIAYATGGVAEGIDHGQTGYLLTTGDVVGLTARLRELFAAPNLRGALGAKGRAAAEGRFSLAALADRHEVFYRRVLGTTSNHR